MGERVCSMLIWLVVSTHLKQNSQNGNLPQIYRGENKKYGKPPPSLIMRLAYGRKDQQQKKLASVQSFNPQSVAHFARHLVRKVEQIKGIFRDPQ